MEPNSKPKQIVRAASSYPNKAHNRLETLKEEMSGQLITHKPLLDLVKEKGIQGEFYRYEKRKPSDCPICRCMGIRHRYNLPIKVWVTNLIIFDKIAGTIKNRFFAFRSPVAVSLPAPVFSP